jgi:hypothetical protein
MACHFRSRPTIISPRFTKWLSLVRWPMLLLVATNSAALNCKTGSGGPASYMGYLPLYAPDGERRKPCGQGPPLIQPDGAVVKASNEGGCDDEDVDEDDGTSTDRWVSGSGTPGSFCLACWGFLGLWRLWFLCWGTTGSRCFIHGLFLILEPSQFC